MKSIYKAGVCAIVGCPRRYWGWWGGSLVLQVAEGGGHVLEELVEVSLDLSLAVFHGVLRGKRKNENKKNGTLVAYLR